MMAAGTDDPVSPERGQGEVSAGGEPEGSTASEAARYNAHMSETEEELRARLSEKDDRIAELETEVEQLEAERADVARAYAEALAAGDTVFDEDDLVEKFEVAEMREKFESTEDATLAEVEPAVQSGGSEPEEEASLSENEREEVADLRENIAELAGSDARIAEIQREQHAERIAELTGEDADEILAEEA
jgi:seryl-tRNA synthetase